MRLHFCISLSLVLLLILGIQLVACEEQLVPMLTIDTTKNDDDSKDACKRLLTGETFILSIGPMISTALILLTSDLFLYELQDENLDEKTQPPYRILINSQPKHLRTRFPTSYSALVNITNYILNSFTMALQTPDIPAIQEYIVFSYINSENHTCLFAIDVRLDQPEYGPCSAILGFSKGISSPPENSFRASFIKSDTRPQVACPVASYFTLFKSEPNYSDPFAEWPGPCFKLEQCTFVEFDYPTQPNGTAYFESLEHCRPITEGIIRSGYLPTASRLYLFDERQLVHIMENTIYLDFTRRPLTQFLGCDVDIPWRFQFRKTTIGVIIAVALVGQLALCVGVYFVFKNMTPYDAKLDKGKRKSKKKKKKRKSIKSTTSKSRASVSKGSKSTKSRLSRGSTLAADSVIISKCQSPQISHSSKSRLSRRSRGSRQQNSTSIAPTDTAPISFSQSVSQQRTSTR